MGFNQLVNKVGKGLAKFSTEALRDARFVSHNALKGLNYAHKGYRYGKDYLYKNSGFLEPAVRQAIKLIENEPLGQTFNAERKYLTSMVKTADDSIKRLQLENNKLAKFYGT